MDRRAAGRLGRAIAPVEARFGAGFARRLRDHRPSFDSPAVPTGSLALDLATGTGGLPRGHVAEFVDPPSSGRASLLYAAIAAAQRGGHPVGIIDVEGTADAESLIAASCDLDTMTLGEDRALAERMRAAIVVAYANARAV